MPDIKSRGGYEAWRSGDEAPDEVEIGVSGIALAPADQIAEAQEGYAVEGGDWKDSWLVIGREIAEGDPIFLDLARPGAPVYTAAHGQGDWEDRETRIADSLDGFVAALRALQQVARGREGLTDMQEVNPVSEGERDEYLAAVRDANPDADLFFWELL